MVVLKPLEQALKDNDTIRAVIVGRYVASSNQTSYATIISFKY